MDSEIVSHARSLRHTLGVVRHHHERWDGRGYPDHLVGARIPLFWLRHRRGLDDPDGFQLHLRRVDALE